MSDPETFIEADNYFAQIPYWVLQLGLSSSAIHLYVVLIKFSNWESKRSYPSRKTLSQYLGVSVKTVDRAKDELVAAKVLEYQKRYLEDGEQTSNFYRIITNSPQGGATKTTLPSDKNDIGGGDKNDIQSITIINYNQLTKKKEVEQGSPEISEICYYLAKAIELRGLKPRPNEDWINGSRWQSEARLLLLGRIGEGDTLEASATLTVAQIKGAIDYAMNDPFWAKNILSPGSLRKKYPRLRMQAKTDHEKRQPKGLSAIQQIREEESRKEPKNALQG